MTYTVEMKCISKAFKYLIKENYRFTWGFEELYNTWPK